MHKALGVAPWPVEVEHRKREEEPKVELKIKGSSLRATWKQEDDTLSISDSESVQEPSKALDDDGEEGRYNIGQGSRKRQRPNDLHAVFTTDDDEDGEVLSTSSEEEGAEPPVKRRRTDRSPGSAERKRGYWLSKGIGFGDGDGDESS